MLAGGEVDEGGGETGEEDCSLRVRLEAPQTIMGGYSCGNRWGVMAKSGVKSCIRGCST